MKITINMQKIAGDQYYCEGQRLAFDHPWEIYVVNHDMYIPYFRVHINGRCTAFTHTEHDAYLYLKKLSKAQAHSPNDKNTQETDVLLPYEKQLASGTIAMYQQKGWAKEDLDPAKIETEVSRYLNNMDSDHRYAMEEFITAEIEKRY